MGIAGAFGPGMAGMPVALAIVLYDGVERGTRRWGANSMIQKKGKGVEVALGRVAAMLMLMSKVLDVARAALTSSASNLRAPRWSHILNAELTQEGVV